ncbi:MAG: hypothetical protein ACR2PT_19970 [Endozoicomonas sp.]
MLRLAELAESVFTLPTILSLLFPNVSVELTTGHDSFQQGGIFVTAQNSLADQQSTSPNASDTGEVPEKDSVLPMKNEQLRIF